MERKLISFDWAIKKILRSKANFEILEGFLSVLLNDDLKIFEILDSESNKESEHNKNNRVDIKLRDKKDQIIIVDCTVSMDDYSGGMQGRGKEVMTLEQARQRRARSITLSLRSDALL